MAEIKSIKSLQESEDASKTDLARIGHVLDNLLKLASGDFNIQELQDVKYDNLDAIDRGIVMLSEHLEENKQEHEKHIKEKEDLIKEIHHRVKNNLQIVSSLLNLQSQFTKHNSAKQALKQSQYRINSMSMIHEMLYRSENITEVKFKEYLDKLTKLLVDSIKGNTNKILLEIESPNINVKLDTAVTIGVLINEVISNALLHGVEDDGVIYARLTRNSNNEYSLELGDDGKGFAEDVERDSLGLHLIEILSDQLDAKMNRRIENGTHYSFELQESIFC